MKTFTNRCRVLVGFAAAAALLATGAVAQKAKPAPTPGPMLAQGIQHLETPGFDVDLVRSSQTIAALKPRGADGFDFTPGDLLTARSQNGFYHLGDLDLRLRAGDSGSWQSYSTAHARQPLTPLPIRGNELASANLAPTLPADIPLDIVRTWRIDGETWRCALW